MVAFKDWNEMSKYGCWWRCDRKTFTPVKVLNFDNITKTIPIYPIINKCYKNKRNKNLSEGGRTKRFDNWDHDRIKFCTS